MGPFKNLNMTADGSATVVCVGFLCLWLISLQDGVFASSAQIMIMYCVSFVTAAYSVVVLKAFKDYYRNDDHDQAQDREKKDD